MKYLSSATTIYITVSSPHRHKYTTHSTRDTYVLLHICVFGPDATRLAQSSLTQRGHVVWSLGASEQAAKECGCRSEAVKTAYELKNV